MKRETKILGYLAAAAAGAFFLLRKKRATAAVQEDVEEEVPEGIPGTFRRGSYRDWTWRLWKGEPVEGFPPQKWMAHIGAPGVDIDESPGDAEYIGHYKMALLGIAAATNAIDQRIPAKFKEDLQP